MIQVADVDRSTSYSPWVACTVRGKLLRALTVNAALNVICVVVVVGDM